MKRTGQWIRSCAGRLLDLLGRFRLMTILKAAVIVAVILFTLSLLLSNRIAQGLIHSEYKEYNETIFRQAETAINRPSSTCASCAISSWPTIPSRNTCPPPPSRIAWP